MEFRVDSLDFSQPLRGSGPRSATKTLVFPRNVLSAVAGLGGYLTEFSGNDDHHVGKIDVRLSTEITGNTVTVTGDFGLRDWSGNWDDDYDGVVTFVVVAELESATAPPPRRDLAITGVEFNQATQFFRANRFLDLANVRPDNSVFLIEGKATGVRVYVDYDASSGLPPIALLGGELVVSNGGGSTTLSPIIPIVPKRDALINQALPGDTLNFMIPAGLSAGTVTVTCRVFDAANPSPASQAFTRTLVFTPVEPLNVFLVGIQTQKPAAAAPTQAAAATAFSLLVSTYPRGLVQFTGFAQAVLAPAITGSMATSGCGDAWSTLLDQLRDLKGGSGDVYFGALPAGIFTAGVVGCSPVGDRVAAAFIDLPATIPHEVGHSLGLHHDPCTGCTPPAQDPNQDYPRYNTFGSDSIGVFGFDPTKNAVFSPSSATDFMTAFLPAIPWVSPYTYQKLLGPTQGGPPPEGAMTLLRGQREMLFLGLEISRERKVHRRVSFHHPAVIQGTAGCPSAFVYELLDADRKVLDCGPLHCMCVSRGCACWPKTTRDVVPYPDGAAALTVYEGDKLLYEETIPPPPTVKIRHQAHEQEGIRLSWTSSPDAKTYLVHYRIGLEAWRGLTPRLETPTVLVPRRHFARSSTLSVRVLASSGIATGYAEVDLDRGDNQPPDVTVTLPGVGPIDKGGAPVAAVPFALATDPAGKQVAETNLSWYDDRGASLGRGSRVDLRQLPEGRSTVRVVVRGHGGRSVGKSWIVERRGDRFSVVAVMCDPPRRPRNPPHEHPHPAPAPCKE